ncbi:UNVERIFIED_CONTAM: hypothetical protein Sradi_1908400 [Sesamum radiatum]|uniref:Ty3 transposon capsid-like protein domain-containing protein n=1 Tax=Sesamum radiatum TaxID=300843 RepID=A0AAW2TZK4_SESRA
MADGTRLKELHEAQRKTDLLLVDERARRQAGEEQTHECLDQITETQEGLKSAVVNVERGLATVQQQLQSIIEQLQHYNKNKSILGEGLTASMDKGSSSRITIHHLIGNETTNQSNSGSYNALHRMEFPLFNGEDARAWIRRCTRYFQMIPIPEDQKVPLASVHMEGRAELWYQSHVEKRGEPSSAELIVAILERFEDLDHERVVSDFNQLHQETTVHAYLQRFEELEAQMLIFNKNLGEEFFMMKFISGLKQEIKGHVATMNPTTLTQAIVLARKQEITVNAILSKTQPNLKNTQPKPTYRPQNKTPTFKPSYKPSFKSRNENSQPRRLLTEAEMRARREKNLCYNCDEIFTPEEVQAYEEENEQVEEQGEEAETEDVTLSLNAMRGNVSSGTLRVKGIVNGKEIHILIDSGSTHSFIDEKVAKALGIKTELTTLMVVSVADGYKMMSKVICPELSWEIQGFQFTYPVRTLKLGGCDFVLGCDWLGAHNPVELDFDQLTVTISQKDGKVILRALPQKNGSMLITPDSLSGLLGRKTYDLFGQMLSTETLKDRGSHLMRMV